MYTGSRPSPIQTCTLKPLKAGNPEALASEQPLSSQTSLPEVLSPCSREWTPLGTPASWSSTPCRREWSLTPCLRKPEGQFATVQKTQEIQDWQPERFMLKQKLQSAPKNHGRVDWMFDIARGEHVAVKVMPNNWVCRSHEDFLVHHADAVEQPWMDFACAAFLQATAFPYCCPLLGIYRDSEATRAVTALATHGDFFAWASSCKCGPGPEREQLVLPLAVQLLDAVRWLHNLGIVHRDISLENVLLKQLDDGSFQLQLIDFSMASTSRWSSGLECCLRGKNIYRAPEAYRGGACDGFHLDSFAVGVALYAAVVGDHPWFSTEPGRCKIFSYAREEGFRALADKRKISNYRARVSERLSGPLIQLLAGLLAFDPEERTTLGELAWSGCWRQSVWEEAWLCDKGF